MVAAHVQPPALVLRHQAAGEAHQVQVEDRMLTIAALRHFLVPGGVTREKQRNKREMGWYVNKPSCDVCSKSWFVPLYVHSLSVQRVCRRQRGSKGYAVTTAQHVYTAAKDCTKSAL